MSFSYLNKITDCYPYFKNCYTTILYEVCLGTANPWLYSTGEIITMQWNILNVLEKIAIKSLITVTFNEMVDYWGKRIKFFFTLYYATEE